MAPIQKTTITTPSEREIQSPVGRRFTDPGRTRILVTSWFFTREDRDGMLQSGMEQGLEQSYAALDELLGARRDDGPRLAAPGS